MEREREREKFWKWKRRVILDFMIVFTSWNNRVSFTRKENKRNKRIDAVLFHREKIKNESIKEQHLWHDLFLYSISTVTRLADVWKWWSQICSFDLRVRIAVVTTSIIISHHSWSFFQNTREWKRFNQLL